ncbi:F-box/kelch-repeat protein At3g23880-like [Trifolium pratense]|uniref:F-box/kelch-repeat protein At3g23880-like n=1 Tax=Trifolium pratense TaxID=57577 RepID=UPI001E69396A|nr:F-box/kelch-repeat protein At3g23880-like [Trifolium pratense]
MGDKVNDVVSSPLLLTEETIAGNLTSPPSLSPTLPFDLIPEILCKLPVKLLLQLRCICKSWNFLISDPNFIKKHFRQSTTHLVHILTYSENFLNSYTIDSVLTDQTAITSKLEFRNHRGVSFVGSCNGILCFLVKKDYENLITIQLWNPSIRKLKVLPPFEKPAFKMYGFGHDPVSDSYKVVVVLDVLDDRRNLVEKQINDVKVHTLGTNLWRNIQKLKFPFVIKPLRRSGIYVSGTINWLVKDHLLLRDCPRKNHYFVVSLDLRNESYKKILLPYYGKVGVGGYSTLHLSVFRDCLCMISRQDVWIRKEYGNPNSWIKLLTISYMQDPSTSWVFTNAMHIFEDGQVFVRSAGGGIGKLVVYNSKNESFELPFPSENTLEICVESLISPCS